MKRTISYQKDIMRIHPINTEFSMQLFDIDKFSIHLSIIEVWENKITTKSKHILW